MTVAAAPRLHLRRRFARRGPAPAPHPASPDAAADLPAATAGGALPGFRRGALSDAPGGAGPAIPSAAPAIRRAAVAATGWWRDRSPAERRSLGAGAGIAAAAALQLLVWQPLVAVRTAAAVAIARDDRLAARLRAAGPEVARIAAARRGSLATLVTGAAARAGLTIARLEPQGAGVAVTLDGVGFDPLVDWLAALDHDAGIVAVELKVERRPDPGLVGAQVTLAER